MNNRNFSFNKDIPKVSFWRFYDFYLLPTIATFTQNTYYYGKKYMFTRYVEFYFLWFSVGVQWDYGKVEKDNELTN